MFTVFRILGDPGEVSSIEGKLKPWGKTNPRSSNMMCRTSGAGLSATTAVEQSLLKCDAQLEGADGFCLS
ncbi:hypothetical protein ACROYT_G014139 [Oculina patagonica]